MINGPNEDTFVSSIAAASQLTPIKATVPTGDETSLRHTQALELPYATRCEMPRIAFLASRSATSTEIENQLWILTRVRAYVRRPPGTPPGHMSEEHGKDPPDV